MEHIPAELRSGNGCLTFTYTDVYRDAPLITKSLFFDVRVQSGMFSGTANCEFSVAELHSFLTQLEELYGFRRDTATLRVLYYGSHFSLSLDKAGHLTISGELYDDSMTQKLSFTFHADQSALLPFLQNLKKSCNHAM